MNRLVICGSPRIDGRCGMLANTLFEACIAEFLEDEVALVPVSELSISGCMGCEGCNALASGGENEPDELVRCVIEDDMDDVYAKVEAADELIVVSPVYFSGPPSQFKALLDRLQPYYQETAEERKAARERGEHFFTGVKPATLHVVGDGGAPQGYDALVSIVQASLAVAGFRLETIVDWVGKISPEGDFLAEAEMFSLVPDGADGDLGEAEELGDSEDGTGNGEEQGSRPVLHFDDPQVELPQKAPTSSPAPKRKQTPQSRANAKSNVKPSGGASKQKPGQRSAMSSKPAKGQGRKPSSTHSDSRKAAAKKQAGKKSGGSKRG